VLVAAWAAAGLVFGLACGSSALSTAPQATPDASHDVKVPPVDPLDAAQPDAAPPPPPDPTCGKYCDAVMEACKGPEAQYATRNDCLSFCAKLDLGDAGDDKEPTVACRAYYASSPSATDPDQYCNVAGPFGGGVCGDRCTTFCQVTLTACSPDAGDAPFPSFADCRTACATFPFKDAGADGGGEGPDAAPTPGNTLNCREFQLRKVAVDGVGCANLGADSGLCR
jgi:hypothetical protein